MDFHTLCIHGSDETYDRTGAVSVPIFQSATFAHPGVMQSTGYDYSRLQNPTREHLEKTVAKLEQGLDAMAFSTGMAAIALVMELFQPGDHIIASDDLYGGSYRLFDHVSKKNGVNVSLTETSDIENIEKLITGDTKAIFIETPTNPTMQVTDIRAVCRLAAGKDILVIVDNTFLTPYYQKPLCLGADIVIHSGTKFLGGHNDTLAGFAVVKNQQLSERLRFLYKTIGSCLAPLDSWLIIRGIKTLPIRMDRQQESAGQIAHWLRAQKQVKKVYYIGLEDHPGYRLSKEQSSGFGSMISFEVDSEKRAKDVLERVKLIQYAESLGGTETLITFPKLQTHADVPQQELDRKGINERFLRLSVGLEDCDDLIADLKYALEGE